MKLFTGKQIKEYDQYTIRETPISSYDLMEKASRSLSFEILKNCGTESNYIVVCGYGNNGGDGLAIARMLHTRKIKVQVFLCNPGGILMSPETKKNLELLEDLISVCQVNAVEDFNPDIVERSIIIDALLGSGTNRRPQGLYLEIIRRMNNSKAKIISVDLPSGLKTEEILCSTDMDMVVHSDFTYAIEQAKLSFFYPENEKAVGEWSVIKIGLHPQFSKITESPYYLIDAEEIKNIYKPRSKFSHKGTFGHCLIIAGSKGKMGAASLASKAALRSGAGLVTAFVPNAGIDIIQSTVPEVMAMEGGLHEYISEAVDGIENFEAICIGPGIGKKQATKEVLEQLLKSSKRPVVLDADALNLLAEHKNLLNFLPKESILTPHLKEFDRICGEHSDSFSRQEGQQKFAKKYGVYVILKGAHSCIASPDGSLWFNATGNPGMATAGSGDVLTGIVCSLLSQGYTSQEACKLSVYVHGLAGDLALRNQSTESLCAGDIIDSLGLAFKQIQHFSSH